MSPTATPVVAPSVFVPNLSGEVGPKTELAIRQLFTTAHEHNQAINNAIAMAKAATATTKTASTAATTSTSTTSLTTNGMPTLGRVNNQTGTTYTTQSSDYGGIVTFANADPVAVTLNNAVAQFWYAAIQNLGPGPVTVTPQAGAEINGEANLALDPNEGAWVFFDGQSYWALTGPLPAQSIAAAPHEFLVSYSAETGAFAAAQPQFSDIGGAATFVGTVTQPDATMLTAPSIATSATAGTATALPLQPAGYLVMSLAGQSFKVPYYAP